MPTADKIPVDSALLRRLHSLHQQAHDLREQIDRGPRQVAAAQTIVDKSQQKLDDAAAAVRSETMRADEKQLRMKAREDKVHSLEGQLNTASSNKEFALLKEQIAAERQANDCLSDEIFEVLERIDVLNEKVATAKVELKENQDAKSQRESDVETRMKVVREDLIDVESKLTHEETKFPAAARPLYDRLIAANGAEAMAMVDGTSCGNCNQVMRTQLFDELAMGVLMQCPACHAILYRPA